MAKDEEIRKLKFRVACLEDDVEELNETLAKEEERADLLLQDLDEERARSEECRRHERRSARRADRASKEAERRRRSSR